MCPTFKCFNVSKMESIKRFTIVIIGFYVFVSEARHVALTGQGASSPPRTRLLVIRPPPGTNQPNRVLLITDQRKIPDDVETPRNDPSRTRASDPFRQNLNKPVERRVTVQHHGHNAGHHGSNVISGHPQSQIRRRNMEAQGGQSLRNLLDSARNIRRRPPTAGNSNIARISETIPRAASISIPTDARFGDLNMPIGIEAALNKLRHQSINMGRTRNQVQGNIQGQIPNRNPTMTRNILNILRQTLKNTNAPQTGRNNGGSGRFSVGNVNSNTKRPTIRPDRGNSGSNLRTREPAMNTIRTTTNDSLSTTGNQSNSVNASNKRVINTNTSMISPQSGKVNPAATSTITDTPNLTTHKVAGDVNTSTNGKAVNSPGVRSTSIPGAKKGVVKLNATAEVRAAKAERNTTETKSLKTKNIKVTTVIKGGTAADVAAAAASQAEIAKAVAQGKEINSTALAEIAAKASAAKLNNTKQPVGSITVVREPNGISVITLSDGQGEPVVLRASGPVKIERIIKPNGKVQFLINPVTPKKPVAIDPEIEADEMMTTVDSLSTNLNFIFSGQTTVPTPLAPTFIPPSSLSPLFDSVLTTTPYPPKSQTNGPSTKAHGVPSDLKITDSLIKSKTTPGIPLNGGVKVKRTANSIGPIVDPGGTVSTGKAVSTVNDVTGSGAVLNVKIPRPPKLTDAIFGPFDMLNSVIDFNKNIPRPSDVSVLSTIPTTFQPSLSKVSTVRKKNIRLTDAMPQYKLVSSSPPLKVVPKPFS